MMGFSNVHGPLAGFRAAIVDSLISAYLVVQTLTIVVSSLRPAPRLDAVYGVWLVGLVVIGWLRFARGLSLGVRVWGVAFFSSTNAIGAVVWTGLVPPTVAVLIAICGVLVTIGVGHRAALHYLVGVGAAIVVVGGLVVSRQLVPAVNAQTWYDPHVFQNWVRQALNVTLVASVLAVTVHLVVSRVDREMSVRRVEGLEHARCSAALLDLARDPVVESGQLGAALARLTQAGADGLDVRRASVWMLEGEGSRLACRATFDDRKSSAGGERAIDVERHPAYFEALAAGRSVAAEDARLDPATRELTSTYLDVLGIASMVVAPIRLHDVIVGVVCLEHVGDPRPWSSEARSFAGSLADFAARALSAAERTEAYELLGRLHRRVENAKEEERRHLARELHDELGQVLTALKLRLQLAATPPGGEVGARLGDAVGLVDGLIAQVRKLSLDLTPPLLVEAGIAPAIGAYLDGHLALAGVAFDFDSEGLEERLAPELEIGAFRVVQEALTNVLRHARARHVQISMRRTGDVLCLGVRDDGCGFDVGEVFRGPGKERHFGLAGMRERVKGLGGTFELRSSTGKKGRMGASPPPELLLLLGTEVRVTLPLSPLTR